MSCLNDCRPVPLTPIITKCFERLILSHIKSAIPADHDNHPFAYRANRSTEDAVITALHSPHTSGQGPHLCRASVLWISAWLLTLLSPHKLMLRLSNLILGSSPCEWFLGFLSNRPQDIRMGRYKSSTLILNILISVPCTIPYSYMTVSLETLAERRVKDKICAILDNPSPHPPHDELRLSCELQDITAQRALCPLHTWGGGREGEALQIHRCPRHGRSRPDHAHLTPGEEGSTETILLEEVETCSSASTPAHQLLSASD